MDGRTQRGGPFPPGALNPNWKGDGVGYVAAHERVKKARGTPSQCEKCGATDPGTRYEWALIQGLGTHREAARGEYSTSTTSYVRLCKPCHERYDGKATPEHRAKLSAALTGHPVTAETRSKLSAAAMGRSPTSETRAKMSAAAYGRGVRGAAERLAATVLDAFDSHRWTLLWDRWVCTSCGLSLEDAKGRRCHPGGTDL
jgi:hypothetical protein